jgi:hypothetical protein
MKKLISISLSIIVLIGNLWLTQGIHFCGGEIADITVAAGQSELDCGMERKVEQSCHHHHHDDGSDQMKKKSCCEDVYHSFILDTDYQISDIQNLPLVKFAVAFISTYIPNLVQPQSLAKLAHYEAPPPESSSFQALFQIFRL